MRLAPAHAPTWEVLRNSDYLLLETLKSGRDTMHSVDIKKK